MSLNSDARKTIEISGKEVREFQKQLRADRIAKGELDIDDWEEPTGVFDIPPMLQLIKEPVTSEMRRICNTCRDAYVSLHSDHKCSTCSLDQVDKGWSL